jgi:hypothetical protein
MTIAKKSIISKQEICGLSSRNLQRWDNALFYVEKLRVLNFYGHGDFVDFIHHIKRRKEISEMFLAASNAQNDERRILYDKAAEATE